MPHTLSQAARQAQARAYYDELKKRDPSLTPTHTVTNGTATGTYTGPQMKSARPGADDHLSINSRGIG